MRLLLPLCTLLILFHCGYQPALGADSISRIGFGSCTKENRDQPIWNSIVDSKPDVFLMIGDNIYADTVDMGVMREKYQMLAAKPGFKQLRDATSFLATWDDHDYGKNDAGAEYPMKAASREVFLEFWGKGHPDQQYGDEGVYSSLLVGKEGHRVQILLLDTRYFRSQLQREKIDRKMTYVPVSGEGVTMLGERQWQWLEQQLKQPADLRILASSIQVIPSEHRWEKWSNMPQERERLFKLIGTTQANGVIIISGDRHLGELSMIPNSAAGYPLYEITSSSLNMPIGGNDNEPNRHRIAEANFGKANFGMILVDWEQDDPVITLELRDLNGETVRAESVRLSQLQK